MKVNGESRGHPISPVKYNLYFHCSENTAFYIFTAVKHSFFLKYALYLLHIFQYFITLYIKGVFVTEYLDQSIVVGKMNLFAVKVRLK